MFGAVDMYKRRVREPGTSENHVTTSIGRQSVVDVIHDGDGDGPDNGDGDGDGHNGAENPRKRRRRDTGA